MRCTIRIIYKYVLEQFFFKTLSNLKPLLSVYNASCLIINLFCDCYHNTCIKEIGNSYQKRTTLDVIDQ